MIQAAAVQMKGSPWDAPLVVLAAEATSRLSNFWVDQNALARAVGAGPPVGQAVGVEHQDGPWWHADRLLPVGGHPSDALAPHAEQDALVQELELAHLPGTDQ